MKLEFYERVGKNCEWGPFFAPDSAKKGMFWKKNLKGTLVNVKDFFAYCKFAFHLINMILFCIYIEIVVKSGSSSHKCVTVKFKNLKRYKERSDKPAGLHSLAGSLFRSIFVNGKKTHLCI